MIFVSRSSSPSIVNYKGESIREIIKNDFFKMCYLCEEVTRHYEIDHFYPQNAYPHLENDWNNLFYVCEKCNKIRPKNINTSSENEVLDNTQDDVENLIVLRYNEVKNEIEITSNNQNPKLLRKVNNTIILLDKIYNGKETTSNSYIDLRDDIRNEIESFRNLLDTYEEVIPFLKIGYEEKIARKLSKKTMTLDSSFVSFKRRIILDNPQWLDFKIYFD